MNVEIAGLRAELELERDRNADLRATMDGLNRSVEELRTFARDVSHDLKAPLAGILGYAQLLEHLDFGLPRPPGYDEFVSEINRSADRMRRLIDDVLAYSATADSPLRLGPIDLSTLVDDLTADAVGLIRPTPTITHDILPAVHGDHGMVRRLLENLIGNAIKYVPLGEAARVHVSARVLDDMVRIEITDHGIGIQDGQHEAIFEELHRAHPEAYPGNGLGLPICRRIVQRMGGAIGADPSFRGGARIWFTLPPARRAGDPQPAVVPELDHTPV
ncbi:sensor histidine kinase [Actinoplanes sichuanensis]|uniref:Sensor-like histidine kinase SenX3 n=1 Tax=Actinoplanes sichuanensis TaxID=512349 RepID=A0ABW4A0L5_9ACTN|nr:HAMP domain-containing sensor histidine kinase [Actinoplanes sichuanensis]